MATMGGDTKAKTRWIVEIRDPFGRPLTLVVQAHDGYVYAAVGDLQAKHSPREVSEIRQVLLEAQSAAFVQRGGRFD